MNLEVFEVRGNDKNLDNVKETELSGEEAMVNVNEVDTDEDVRGYNEISVKENDDQLDYEVYEDTNEEVRGYEEIAVNENDDQMNNKVHEDILDYEVKNFEVDVEKNSKVKDENLNKFIEVKVERNVVKLLFEGTFKENTEEILENLDKFPEPEIEMEEATSEEANVLKVERQMETSSEKSLLVDNLNRTLDKYQDIPEDGIKAQKDSTDPRLTVAKNVVSLGAKKTTVVDEALAQEHGADADAATVIDGNIPAEWWTARVVIAKTDEHETPASSSKKALMLKTIAKLVIPEVATIPVNASTMDKYWFDKEHNCVLAKVLVIDIAAKPTGTLLVNYSQMMNDRIGLDILKKPVSFGDQEICCAGSAAML